MERKHHIAQSRVRGVLTDLKRLSPDFVNVFPRPLDDIIQLLYPVSLIEYEDLTFAKIAGYLDQVGMSYDWPGDYNEPLAGFILFKNGHGLIFTEKNGNAGFCRFTKAHELGHFWDFRKKEDITFACRDYPRPENITQTFDYSEVRANQFAAELLMPAALIEQYRSYTGNEDSLITEVVERFGVSRAAAKIRLKEFGILSNDL
ncbi:MAG TPA: ImmA/IrrE family metallo-endopeptidase [Acidobacteriota bacterium]|nr:ImmA/IrrE family metallo-endopeptidase [Acidobacteriota bacterium]